jgi:hypothetical protein
MTHTLDRARTAEDLLRAGLAATFQLAEPDFVAGPAEIPETLRAAASTIRERLAQLSRPFDPWFYQRGPAAPYAGQIAASEDPEWSGVADVLTSSGAGDYITTMAPTVGWALAQWLDTAADRADQRRCDPTWLVPLAEHAQDERTELFGALAAARAILATLRQAPTVRAEAGWLE